MPLPNNLIVNADDFGFNTTINKAILFCYENEIINSTSLMTNKPGFEEAVEMIRSNNSVKNIGLHVNFADGAPLTNFNDRNFLTVHGNWDFSKTGKRLHFLSSETKKCLAVEIQAQIDKAITSGIKITHLDSHCHLHTLPGLYPLFIEAGKRCQLKIRLAQTYNENNYAKFFFRRFFNNRVIKSGLNYSDRFESVDHLTKHDLPGQLKVITEVMLHPDFDSSGNLTDHLLATDMTELISWLQISPLLKA